MKRLILLTIGIFILYTGYCQNTSQEATNTPEDSVTLQEVVVTATKPLTRFKGEGLVTTIAGTTLGKLGTAKDVLGFIPGVSNNNGNIEVFGKGTPLIYINGRVMRNHIELEQLSSDKLKDIMVINNPGAKYAANTQAVIRITTVKEFGEGFSLDTKTVAGYKDFLYGKEQIGLNYRIGGLDLYGMFEYNNTRGKGTSSNIQNTWAEEHNMTMLDMHSKSKSQLYDGQVGINYTTKSNHSFGVYYKFIHKPNKTDVSTVSSLWIDEQLQENSILSQEKESDYYEHLVDGYYSGRFGKWTTDLTFNLLWRNKNDNQYIKKDMDVFPISIYDKSNGRMLAGEFHVSRPIWTGNLNLGTEYTNSTRKENSSNEGAVVAVTNNCIEENNVSVYGELVQRLGSLTLQMGLRYEYTNSNYFEYGKMITDQSRNYNKLLPSATLTFPIKQVMFQLNYSRKYTRPLYSQLSSTVYYVNQYIYETGNPLLRTPFSDNVSLNMKYKWLMASATYKHVTDPIITTCSSYDNSAITLLKKENSFEDLHNLQIMLSAMPGFIGKVYYPVLSVGMLTQSYKVDYKGKTINMNHPMMILQFNNILRFPHNFTFTSNFKYRSAGDGENIRMGQSWQIDLGMTKTFNSHWNVKLSVNDVLNTAKDTKFTMYSGLRNVQIEKSLNTRYIELNVGYKFNMPKSRYRGKGAGNSEKSRL